LGDPAKTGNMEEEEKEKPQKLAYSVPDAAYALSLSPDYVWKLIYSGELRSLKVGKRRLITLAMLEEFLEGR
jgi:excisionase family DNA binding protein